MQQRHFEKRKRGRPLKDRRKHLQIAATIDYRGTDDDVLSLLRNMTLSVAMEKATGA